MFRAKTVFRDSKRRGGGLSARFRRPRVLIVGVGDVGVRLARLQLHNSARGRGVRFLGIVARDDAPRRAALAAQGVTVIAGDLDRPHSLRRAAGLGARVIYLAPPAAQGVRDERMARALAKLGPRARGWVYVSTTGVYGDCGGDWVQETRLTRATTARAIRRVDAERQVRARAVRQARLAHRGKFDSNLGPNAVLRSSGIYAADRAAGPVSRLKAGTPVLRPADDVWSNHIHAEDLAAACWAALWRAGNGRVFNICDDAAVLSGDYFDHVADVFQLPRPARLSRAQIRDYLTPVQMSFLEESRRLSNQRMKRELRLNLKYPTIADGWKMEYAEK